MLIWSLFSRHWRRESSTWALPARARSNSSDTGQGQVLLLRSASGHRFRGSDLASPIWALRHRDMLRVCARAAASDEMSGHIVSELDNIPGGNRLAWQCEPSPARLGAGVRISEHAGFGMRLRATHNSSQAHSISPCTRGSPASFFLWDLKRHLANLAF